MFVKQLTSGSRTQRFVVRRAHGSGWEMREEHDGQAIREAVYHDWHRAERAAKIFGLQVAHLKSRGWEEVA